MRKRHIKNVPLVAFVLYLMFAGLLSPLLVSAQGTTNPIWDDPCDFVNFIDSLVGWFFTILMLISIMMIIYAGFLYTSSGGDQEQISKAKKALIYAIVGLIVGLISKTVPAILAAMLGASMGGLTC